MTEIKALAEKYLGAPIPPILYEGALEKAARKLERIISQEGDADGERLKPYYLAQLVAEALRIDIFTYRCFEDKKRAAHSKADNSSYQPHYSTICIDLSRANSNF